MVIIDLTFLSDFVSINQIERGLFMSFIRKRFKVLSSLLLVLIISITCVTPAFAADPDTWEAVASMATARSQFCSAVVNGNIYVFGGMSGSAVTNTVEEYNPTTDTWTTKAPLPVACKDSEATVINGKVYIVGGGGSNGYGIHAIFIYDPTTDSYTTKNLSTGGYRHQVAVVDGKIYVIGGEDTAGEKTNVVEVYDPIAGTCANVAPMNIARFNFAVAVVNGKIYAIGGNTNTDAAINSVEVYDPTTNTWTTKAPMNSVRTMHEVAVLNDKIYAVGGQTASANLDSVEVYDPVTNTWTIKAPMLKQKAAFPLIVVNGNIFVFSGYLDMSAVEQYNPETNLWTAKASMLHCRYLSQEVVLNNAIYAIGGTETGYASSVINSVEKYALPAILPAAPTGLTAIASDAKVDLTWGAVTEATSYNVYRSTTSGGTYTKIADNVTGTTYTDSSVTNGTTYYYVVTAVSTGGESANSNEVSATPNKAEAGFAILDIYMVDGTLKEYDLTMAKVNEFIEWYDQRAAGTGKSYFIIEKTYNKGPFKVRKDYIIFDKIKDFEVNQYD